jgi:hypothetical protein
MNNKKNEVKNLQNAKKLATYLCVNKNRFTPNHQKSEYIYIDKKTISDELQCSEKTVYRWIGECVNRNFLKCVSDKHCYFPNGQRQSRLYHINLIALAPHLDKKIIETEADRFLKTKLKSINNNDMLSRFVNNSVIFDKFKYGKQTKKYIDCIHTSLKHFLIARDEIIFNKPFENANELIHKINASNKSQCEFITFNERLKIYKTPKRYGIQKSCRATSKFCNSSKNILRPELNKLLNLKYEFDIPSAVPSIFRLFNNNIFNLNDNIRQMIIDGANINSVCDEKEFKKLQLIYRLMFAKSFDESHAKVKWSRILPSWVSLRWKTLWDVTHNIIGDTSIGSEIFKYESLLELRTVIALRENNFYTTNCYDCFYSEASPDIIKNELAKQAIILYDDFVNQRI